jgi:hypothetical protein
MEIKKNLPLFVALGIPVVLTVVIALAIYVPGFGAEPSYDFVYATRNYVGYGSSYDVKDGKIVEQPAFPSGMEESFPQSVSPAQLYYYDVESGTSRSLNMQEAQVYRLETSRTSPDGYLLKNGSSGGIFPFYESGNYQDQYLVGNNRRVKTTISDYDFMFLGWVLK